MLLSVQPGETRVVPLDLFGVRVDVVVSGGLAAELESAVRHTWSRCLAADPERSAESFVEVCHDDEALLAPAHEAGVAASDDEVVLLDHLSTQLTQQALALRVGHLLLLHACAVADPVTGAAVVLVAPSGVGKTTASVSLGRRFGYVTDETAAIGADGRLLAYPKPLSVLVDGQRPKRQLAPDDLGLLPAPDSLQVAAVGLLTRTPDATTPRIGVVPMLQALPAVTEQSSSIYLLPQPLRALARLLDGVGGLRRVEYTEAEDLPDVVAGLLGERA